MPRENARAAAWPFSFLILPSAAPSEASRNFTRDRLSRAKKFSGTFFLLGSTGCQPVVVGSLPTTPRMFKCFDVARSRGFWASCRKEQASSLCSPENYRIASARRRCVGFCSPPLEVTSVETCPGAVSFIPTSLLTPRSSIVTP